MRITLFASLLTLLTGLPCLYANDDPIVPQRDATQASQPASIPETPEDEASPDTKAAERASQSAQRTPLEKARVDASASGQQSADEAAIRQADLAFVDAYERGDAKAAAACFAPDAEYVDEQGTVYSGREAIEECLTEFFAENTGCKLKMNIDSLRFISPGVAIEDGSTSVTLPSSSASVDSRYTTVYVKVDGQWLVASVRDYAPTGRKEHRAQLEQLAWLIGDWVDEGDDALINFSCQPVENGNFLMRQFSIQIAGQEVMNGTQRIGWDPLTGKLRAWVFDSEGAYGEGLWHRDGDNWLLKTTGVLADGQTASSTSIYTLINDHMMTWQSVDYEVDGVQQPDSEVFIIVRRAPAPETDTESALTLETN